ncbi:hypothetical protein D3C76_1825630 [compost metagenome]
MVLVTCWVVWAMQSMSRVEVPLSTAVMKRPCKVSTKRPNASNKAARFSTWGLRMITALPPPNGSPARAAL